MNLYKSFFITCITLILIEKPFDSNAQNLVKKDYNGKAPAGYEIKGKIQGLKEGEKVIMGLVENGEWKFARKDSGYVKNGEFVLKGFVPDGTRMYWMAFEQHPKKVFRLVINNGENMTVNSSDVGDIDSFKHIYLDNVLTLQGSPTNRAYRRLVTGQKMYFQSLQRIRICLDKLKDSVGFNGPLVEGVLQARNAIDMAFYNTFLYKLQDPEIENKQAILWMIKGGDLFDASKRASYLAEVYYNFDIATKESFIGKMLKSYADLCVGRSFPLFNLSTPQGQQIVLKDIIEKNKVTLINFWGSANYLSDGTSPIVKKYHNELKVMYKKYHHKGLSIIGIAAENSATLDSFKDIVKEQEIPWPNVTDLKGHQKGSIIHGVYNEGGHSLPNVTNVLIDETGKILAWDPTGAELQYYLWKAFGE